MRILSWNVGGEHRFLGTLQDGYQHEKEDQEYFLRHILDINADIVGLQETHHALAGKTMTFSEMVSKVGYNRSENYPYGESHIKEESWLSLANFSRYPIKESFFFELPNPNLQKVRENGDVWRSLDVGIACSCLDVDGQEVMLLNTHLVAYHYLGRNAMEGEFQNVRDTIENFVLQYKKVPTVLVGDFNYSYLAEMLPRVFSVGNFFEVFTDTETAPGKGQQDHILLSKHWKVSRYEIRKLEADHYQCIADIDFV